MQAKFSSEQIQMAKKHLKKCLIFLVVRKKQIKPILIIHLILVRMAKIKKTVTDHKGKMWKK